MADLLIKHLNKKALEHSDLENLSNQWGFDEKLIPKALQNIANLFPHYSQHDESHSRSILINIERILGQENIDRLTATDTWLLLEAAFLHDIGMVVPQADKIEAWADPKFHELVESFSQDRGNDLQRFCHMLTLQKSKSSLNLNDMDYSILEASEQFTFLMAEWFRVKHAHRAADIIQNPKSSIGLSSPRTELIPARLFKLLGAVCEMHGSHFNLLFSENGLPYREAGLATEDCHPRYVACLLRLGDLLDMDDNRFCPVMMGIAGENRPDMSKAHEAKHAGITHLRIDRDRIEMSSECSSIDSYLEAYNWTKWIEEEIQNQMAHWGDIVPSRDFGPLPTLGDCKVSLAGEYSVLNDGERPEFSLDQKHAIKLLQGENLYDNKFSCIRELIQNSIDSTLIRLWLENKDKDEGELDFRSPQNIEIVSLLNSKPIEIEFEKSIEKSIDDEKDCWIFKIKDQGMGISHNDLKYMLKIAGSKNNSNKRNTVDGMPEWMKPSGCFGIGFQSIFMLTDEVKIISKSIVDNSTLEVIMYDPSGNKKGLVLVKEIENNVSQKFGCEILIKTSLDNNPQRWHVGGSDKYTNNVLSKYDPQLDGSIPIEASLLTDSVLRYSDNVLVPIKVQASINPLINIRKLPEENKTCKYIDIPSQSLLLSIEFVNNDNPQKYDASYRGQDFDAGYSPIDYISFKFDILSGNAEKWLKFNRSEIKEEAHSDLEEMIYLALYERVRIEMLDVDQFKEVQGNEIYFSLFLKSIAEYRGERHPKWLEWAAKFEDNWLDFKVHENKTIKNILDKPSWTMRRARMESQKYTSQLTFSENTTEVIDFEYDYGGEKLSDFMIQRYFESTNASMRISYKDGDEFYSFSKEGSNEIEDGAIIKALESAMSTYQIYMRGTRYVLNDVKNEWTSLHFKKDMEMSARYLLKLSIPNVKSILLPFLFRIDSANKRPKVQVTDSQLDGLCLWAQPNLQESLSLEEIKSEYIRLIAYIDKLMASSKIWKAAQER